MKKYNLFAVMVGLVLFPLQGMSSWIQTPDIRGLWVGKATGSIIGAEGRVLVTHQQGEDIRALVEGSNFFGKARFVIACKMRGSEIFGSLEGHTFHGFLYRDGTIRGIFRAVTGERFDVILQRPYSAWGFGQPGRW